MKQFQNLLPYLVSLQCNGFHNYVQLIFLTSYIYNTFPVSLFLSEPYTLDLLGNISQC